MSELSSYDYYLPSHLIAQVPVSRRDRSRLLVLDRQTQAFEHRMFCDIGAFLRAGDLLVLNDTKVVPARLEGRRKTGGRVELLLLRALGGEKYQALIKPLGRLQENEAIDLAKGFSCRLLDAKRKIVVFDPPGGRAAMSSVGILPLPPYIRRTPGRMDNMRYQTVFASNEGAVAAPTAGLHFTRSLLASLKKKGVGLEFITLHVNYATFAPVRTDDIRKHKMEEENFRIPRSVVAHIRRVKKEGGRVFCVGTTVVKALEDSAQELLGKESPREISRASTLFIHPPFRFRVTDALITNFHLPRTTLLMLLSAFAGKELILKAYQEAVCQKYRFYSYGDAMLIK